MASTVQQLLESAIQSLSNVEFPRLEAELLLATVLGRPREFLYTWPGHPATAAESSAFHSLLQRRQQGEPVAYLLGHREFWSLDLKINNQVLIPRADTERMIEVVLELFSAEDLNLADLGTGSGAIALALASERPGWNVTATDKSQHAIECARFNAQNLKLANVDFVAGDWCEPLPDKRYDIVVSNPPYIEENDIHLLQGDLRFEPRSALVAADNGLSDLKIIAKEACRILKPGGHLFLEHGYSQAADVHKILELSGYESISTWQDMGGNDRVTGGKWLQ
jgi:release factor glutamine methyltransferase